MLVAARVAIASNDESAWRRVVAPMGPGALIALLLAFALAYLLSACDRRSLQRLIQAARSRGGSRLKSAPAAPRKIKRGEKQSFPGREQAGVGAGHVVSRAATEEVRELTAPSMGCLDRMRQASAPKRSSCQTSPMSSRPPDVASSGFAQAILDGRPDRQRGPPSCGGDHPCGSGRMQRWLWISWNLPGWIAARRISACASRHRLVADDLGVRGFARLRLLRALLWTCRGGSPACCGR